MIPWSLLRGLKAGDALEVAEGAFSLLDEGVYRISDAQFCLADAMCGFSLDLGEAS